MMKYEEFTLDSVVPGQKLFVRRYTPDSAPTGVLQVTHGMAEHSALYDEFCRYLAQNGFVATIFDNLGHGRSVSAGGDFGHFFEGGLYNVVEDAKCLHDLTAGLFPGIPYFIMGHSMGSFVVRAYLAKYGQGLAGAVLMGTSAGIKPHMWFLQRGMLRAAIAQRGERGRSKSIAEMATGPYNRRFGKPRTPNDWVTSDQKEVDKFTNDPMCGFSLTLSGYMALGELLHGINSRQWYEQVPRQVPILLLSGGSDPVGDMGKGVRRVASGLTKTEHECELILYPNIRHALLTEVNKEQVFSDIRSFLEYKAFRMRNAKKTARPSGE